MAAPQPVAVGTGCPKSRTRTTDQAKPTDRSKSARVPPRRSAPRHVPANLGRLGRRVRGATPLGLLILNLANESLESRHRLGERLPLVPRDDLDHVRILEDWERVPAENLHAAGSRTGTRRLVVIGRKSLCQLRFDAFDRRRKRHDSHERTAIGKNHQNRNRHRTNSGYLVRPLAWWFAAVDDR